MYLHHRKSADLDFFLARELEPSDLRAVLRVLREGNFRVEARSVPPRTMLILSARGRNVGHVDFSYFPYDPVAAPKRWRGLRVDAIEDMAVNKVQAVLTRARDRDFVDLYFILREGPEQDVERLLSLARAKFDSGASRVTLAECLLRAEQIEELPKMIRSVSLAKLREFFVALARQLVARGPE